MTTPIPPELPPSLSNKKTDEIARNHMRDGIRWTDPGVILILFAAVIILTIGGLFLSRLYDRSTDNADAARRLGVALSSANNCIKVNCGTPVSTPKTVPIPEPSTTTVVIQAPTPIISAVAIQTAVNTYLEQHPPPVDLNALRAFVNNYLNAHPVPTKTGPSGPPGASGSPGQSGLSGQSGLPGTNGVDGTSPPTLTVDSITPTQSGNILTLNFHFSVGGDQSVDVTLPSGPPGEPCPNTTTVVVQQTTVPPNALGPKVGPATTIAVCVPK